MSCEYTLVFKNIGILKESVQNKENSKKQSPAYFSRKHAVTFLTSFSSDHLTFRNFLSAVHLYNLVINKTTTVQGDGRKFLGHFKCNFTSLHLLSFVVQTAHTVSFPITYFFRLLETISASATPSRPNSCRARPTQTSASRRGRAL